MKPVLGQPSKYRRIVVYAKRGDQPMYSWVAESRVKVGRAGEVARRVAGEIAEHEGRSGMTTGILMLRVGAVVSVGGCRFVVWVRP